MGDYGYDGTVVVAAAQEMVQDMVQVVVVVLVMEVVVEEEEAVVVVEEEVAEEEVAAAAMVQAMVVAPAMDQGLEAMNLEVLDEVRLNIILFLHMDLEVCEIKCMVSLALFLWLGNFA